MGVRGPVAVAVGAVAGCVGLLVVDPNGPSSLWPPCPLFALTGIQCPACGSTRMVHALLHGDFVAAWHLNAVMLVAGLPLLAWLWLRWFRAARRSEPTPRLSSKVGVPVVALAATWMLVRNLVA
ncbi:hypothetical protein FHS29_005958 [Saccharothrix tamanrassetensis]|uniref:DUF2752 domain-containing protein n=1 Tax=Saccharothrix tamanrassetensis TaxID=1051531 RepID=A0A841CT63_9PSEU|nr:DUF2752 domain-containing protein [Saccharothrix tamanrassetensis]MBB5959338.1 hypothetical protein [Saccharothrix tamanrassetensis]